MNQQQIKLGMMGGIVGILMLACNSPVESKPPVSGEQSADSQSVVTSTPQGQKLPLTAQFSFKGQNVRLEVAKTPEEQSMGLMYRTDLAKDRGMLFVFSPPVPARFWMKNTLIPLDMIFLSNGVVKHIGANIPPCVADPCPDYGPATKTLIDRVVELRSGRAAELKLQVGDRLKIEDTKPKG